MGELANFIVKMLNEVINAHGCKDRLVAEDSTYDDIKALFYACKSYTEPRQEDGDADHCKKLGAMIKRCKRALIEGANILLDEMWTADDTRGFQTRTGFSYEHGLKMRDELKAL